MVLLSLWSTANDGAFFASGSQLIPVNETDISVKKEILSLKKIGTSRMEVSVYYEFFNPGEAKELLVGFEAISPVGDVDVTPINGHHPYMRDFTVVLNEQLLKYQIAYVEDSVYYKNGIFKDKGLKNTIDGIYNTNVAEFFYVYHFKATFKKGINIVKHTYNYDLSGSVIEFYSFQYILTAANRWANKGIDDFTLILDMGEFETFCVSKSFFKSKNDWIVNGIAKSKDVARGTFYSENDNAVRFHLQKGVLIFQKKNFRPKGELYVFSDRHMPGTGMILPFSYYLQNFIEGPKNESEKRILKNLPYARRGYVFQSKEIREFYEKAEWYMPNPGYIPEPELLHELEKAWLKKME